MNKELQIFACVAAAKTRWPLAVIALIANVVCAQGYPAKPVRMVTAEPGGSNDVASRLIAQGVSPGLGTQVVVDNRGGASGAIAGQIVAKAAPDGYTLLHYSSGFWILPLLHSMPYDPIRDFSPITLVARSPNVLVVHPSLPVKSVAELIALAKARPGQLNFSSGGTGTTLHLSAELFKTMAGIDIVHVAYRGGGPALNALVSGQVQLLFANATGVAPLQQAGRLRALAVTTAQPSTLFPELPTIAAAGLPGYASGTMSGIWAPARTPAAIVRRLNQDVVRFLKTDAAREQFLNAGLEVVGSTPEEFAAVLRSELAVWGKLIKDANIHAE